MRARRSLFMATDIRRAGALIFFLILIIRIRTTTATTDTTIRSLHPRRLAPPLLNATPEPPAPPRESLLIEWQGDRFVRTTLSQKVSDGESRAPDYAENSSSDKPSSIKSSPDKSRLRSPSASTHAIATQPRELPPAVLVFRDGRHEEISSYTIVSGTIYSKADYWTNGSWTKKIQIADLDVPATLKLNHENGLNFVLPAGPNEVVVRP